jgi:hypothetical protein
VEPFELIEQSFRSAGADAVFDALLRRAREQRDAGLLFNARIMQVRHRLGLPLIQTEAVLDVSAEQRPAYEDAFREAAREAGGLCLAAGDIAGAWPFYRAIGEPAPVAAAIENFEDGENVERIIEIGFQEGVNPRKAFELILRHRGICSAISWAGAANDRETRHHCFRLLVRALYRELAASLTETIAAAEGAAPGTGRVADLIAGRDWLFEGNSSYVDSTHLASVLRFAPELEDEQSLRMALEMAEYGCHLAPMFHFRGDPPFEDIYGDHAMYLRGVLREDVDGAIAHFRGKGDAEVLIDVLVRLGRCAEAIQEFRTRFPHPSPTPMNCPSLAQLCQIAEDYAALKDLSLERNDVLGFAAGVIQLGGPEARRTVTSSSSRS